MLEALVVSSKPWIDACWWSGSINLYHFVWELSIMHVVWKIQPSHRCCVDSESMSPKILFNLYFKIELSHLYKSLLPSAKGLSIYFYVESSSSY